MGNALKLSLSFPDSVKSISSPDSVKSNALKLSLSFPDSVKSIALRSPPTYELTYVPTQVDSSGESDLSDPEMEVSNGIEDGVPDRSILEARPTIEFVLKYRC